MTTETFTSRLGKTPGFPRAPISKENDKVAEEKALQRDLQIHQAHVVMLAEQKIISKQKAAAILNELLDLKSVGTSAFPIDPRLGLYLSTEQYLVEKLGSDVAGTINTGRSRNDLNPTNDRMKTRERIQEIVLAIFELKTVLLQKANEHLDTVMPGYTHHCQQAQPITFAHYLMAFYDALTRDVQRLEETYRVVNRSPMGGGALATSGFPINRARVADLLGFDGIVENSLDATGLFDYALQTTSAIAISLSNLGRFLEGLYLWNTAEFGMVEIADEYCSISSIMPQKKNPVAMEYIRGEGVLVAQNLAGMMSVLKAVSPGGGWEWQYIPNLFSPSANTLQRALEIMAGMIDTLKVNKDVMQRRALEGYGTATELADEIVRRTGLSFRDSHHIVGLMTRMAIQSGKLANEITPEMVDAAAVEVIGRCLDLDVQAIKGALDPVENIRIRNIPGGPAPEEVERMIQNRKGDLVQERLRFENRQKLLEQSAIKLAQTVKVLTK